MEFKGVRVPRHIQGKDFTSFKKEVTDGTGFNGKADITPPRVDLKAYANPHEKLKEVYNRNRTYSGAKPHDSGYAPPSTDDDPSGDGLVSAELHKREQAIYHNQSAEDGWLPQYVNQTASDWRRGMGKGQAEGYPGFDHVPGQQGHGSRNAGLAKHGPSSVENKKQSAPRGNYGPKNSGSGADEMRSPFSAAYRKGAGEGY